MMLGSVMKGARHHETTGQTNQPCQRPWTLPIGPLGSPITGRRATGDGKPGADTRSPPEQVPTPDNRGGPGRDRRRRGEAEAAQDRARGISDDTDNGHAIAVSGEEASYSAVDVTKTGDADGDEADFYGTNAAVYAEEGATLDLDDITVTTDGTHANAVFSYGEGTTVNISDSTIDTTGNCSGGIMVTGGGTLNATDLTVHTTGNSSAAIRSDRGGGTEIVTGGTYTTDGTGSPVIYSTADVTVSDATLESTASQGVVVEGKNSVTLNDVDLTASNTTKNSDKSDYYQAVMIYQSMSGDAAEGEASFSMDGGTLTNANGDVFFVNNTVATIDLDGVATITNEDADGVPARRRRRLGQRGQQRRPRDAQPANEHRRRYRGGRGLGAQPLSDERLHLHGRHQRRRTPATCTWRSRAAARGRSRATPTSRR